VLLFAPAVFLINAVPVRADGGFGAPNMNIAVDHSKGHKTAAVSETVTVDLSGNGVELTATAGGDAAAGQSIGSAATTRNTSTAKTTNGNSKIVQNSASLSTGFSKGGNSITKSRSTAETIVSVNGKTYAVANEVAIAVARNTKFGSSAAVGVEASVSGGANSSVDVAAAKPLAR
jgi:hypothetical protein